jgi:hypothetical protein
MKTLAIALAILVSVLNANASDFGMKNKGKKRDQQKERLQTSMNQQLNRYIYYPDEARTGKMEGKADAMLRLMPEGDVQVFLIQTANPLMKKFIERQVSKMKLNKNEVVAGEIFKYRLVFKAKE